MTSWHQNWISENLKFDYLQTERFFEVREKTFFLVSQVLSYRNEKETSSNVEGTILIKQQALDADLRAIQQINFTENLDLAANTTMLFN